MAGPHEYAEQQAEEATQRAYPHVAVVTSSPAKTSTDAYHAVRVAGVTFVGEDVARVPVVSVGDVHPPTEGTRVLVQFQRGEDPVVVGQLYDGRDSAPSYEAGERRLGHPASNAHVSFETDGTVHVESADGVTTVDVRSDGTVEVNGGGMGVVTDVSTSTDGDGHVTDISVERSSDVEVSK